MRDAGMSTDDSISDTWSQVWSYKAALSYSANMMWQANAFSLYDLSLARLQLLFLFGSAMAACCQQLCAHIRAHEEGSCPNMQEATHNRAATHSRATAPGPCPLPTVLSDGTMCSSGNHLQAMPQEQRVVRLLCDMKLRVALAHQEGAHS